MHISADVLLETECGNLSEEKNAIINDEVKKILRDNEEPLVLEFGVDITNIFVEDNSYIERASAIRKELAKTGILMPVLRIWDNTELKPSEFLLQSYHRVLYREVLESADEKTMDIIFDRLKETVKEHYGYILNEDIVKSMVDNLRVKYPALISNVIPEIIPYHTLRGVMAGLAERGDKLCYMTKIIEVLEGALRKNPNEDMQALIEAVAKEIEREDNAWRRP